MITKNAEFEVSVDLLDEIRDNIPETGDLEISLEEVTSKCVVLKVEIKDKGRPLAECRARLRGGDVLALEDWVNPRKIINASSSQD